MDTLKPYTIENSGSFMPFIVVEGRGWEPVEFIPAVYDHVILANSFSADSKQ